MPKLVARRRPGKNRRWVAEVKTDSTHPPPGLFTKDADTIARTLASRKVSPKGPGSGLRMLNYFINRAGKQLSSRRRAVWSEPRDCFQNGPPRRVEPARELMLAPEHPRGSQPRVVKRSWRP
jgi:hypothetical protein